MKTIETARKEQSEQQSLGTERNGSQSMNIKGAVAVITGAAGGIGRALALEMTKRHVTGLALVDHSETVQQVAKAVNDYAGRTLAFGYSGDVTQDSFRQRVYKEMAEQHGPVNICVPAAGITRDDLAVRIDRETGDARIYPTDQFKRVIDVNLLSVARSNAVFLPLLLAEGRGHVVNTASASVLLAYGFDRLPYVASKHAVVGVSEALAIYLGRWGIGVTCVCPSGVITNIVEQIAVYGASAMPRAPQHPLVEPELVGELVVDAIASGIFLVVTAPEIHDELRERAADIEVYIQRMIKEQVA